MPIKSINGEPIVVDADGIADGSINSTKLADTSLGIAVAQMTKEDNIASFAYSQGGIGNNGFSNNSLLDRVRTNGYLSLDGHDVVMVDVPDGMLCSVFEYKNNKSASTNELLALIYMSEHAHVIKVVSGHYYRFNLYSKDGSNLAPSDTILTEFALYDVTPIADIKDEIGDMVDDKIGEIEEKVYIDTEYDVTVSWLQGGLQVNGFSTADISYGVRNSGFVSFDTFTPKVDSVTVNVPSGLSLRVSEYTSNTSASHGNTLVRHVTPNTDFVEGNFTFEPVSGLYYRFDVRDLQQGTLEPDDTRIANIIKATATVKSKVQEIDSNAFDSMFSSSVGNSGILCAKEHHYTDGSAPVCEWYLLGDPATNDVYYSKDLVSRKYLFTFPDTIGSWSFGIDAGNNIICCKQAEYLSDVAEHSDDTRINPIVYKFSERYTIAHEVDFGSSVKPVGWLSSIGFICTSTGAVLISEYTRPVVETANIWRIDGDPSVASSWSIRQTFTLSGSSEGFKHIHCVQEDFYTGTCYFGTGDDDTSSHVYYSTDNGLTWNVGRENDEKHCRLLNIIFTPDYCYWSTDSNKAGKHWVMRAARNGSGVIDFDNIEDLIEVPYSGGLATYGCAYFEDMGAILLLERADSANPTSIPVRLYDIETGTLRTVATLESASPNGGHLGFRTRFAEWYPKNDEVNLSWHLRGTQLGSVGYNQNKMFGNAGLANAARDINNAILRLRKYSGEYVLTFDTRYI